MVSHVSVSASDIRDKYKDQ